MRRFVLMGVAGCGNTSIGDALAAEGLLSYLDGDTLHPAGNIEKMSRGDPLNDDDRWPWLAQVGQEFRKTDCPTAIGCSALKRSYRDLIRENAAVDVGFAHLAAPMEVIGKRMAARTGHFMPTSLLESQYGALEPLEGDETDQVIDITQSFDDAVSAVRAFIKEKMV